MALHLLESSFTAPGPDRRWDDAFLRSERSRLELGRRSDRMTAAVISALDKLPELPKDVPVVFGSMLGVQSRITALQNDLLDFPEDQIGPIAFSCSVHNAVPGAAAIRFGLKTPVFSLAGFEFLPQRVLQLADAVLADGEADRVLAIFAEERSPFADRAMKLLGLEPTEFAAAFLLDRVLPGQDVFGPADGAGYFDWIGKLLP